jgi:hypothetical protein
VHEAILMATNYPLWKLERAKEAARVSNLDKDQWEIYRLEHVRAFRPDGGLTGEDISGALDANDRQRYRRLMGW